MNSRTGTLWCTLRTSPVAALIGLLGTIAFHDPDPVAAQGFYLDCPTTEVREGESFVVTLVYTGSAHRIGAAWHTEAGTADSTDYVAQDTELIWGSVEDSRDGRLDRTFRTRQDTLIEGNETFTVFFTPTNNVVDMDDPDRDNECGITIIDDDPNITDVRIISTPARDETYGVGESIRFRATFSRAVEVDGNPALGLWVGSNWRSAGYLWGSGTKRLVFGYTVKSEDSDTDGVKMDGGYQDRDGRWHNFSNHTAVTAVGTDTVAYRAYAGFDDQSGHKVDGSLAPVGTNTEITSSPESGDTYRYGETVEYSITFSAKLELEGSRHVNLLVGPTDSEESKNATYQSGSGTNTLVFGYTVQTADRDTLGVRMLGTRFEDFQIKGLEGSGTIKVKGTDREVNPTFDGLTGPKINGQPYPKDISITSTPKSRSDTYGRTEVIQVSVDFGQSVTAHDSSFAILMIFATWGSEEPAVLVSGSGTDTLVFEYTVAVEDLDNDGVAAYVPRGLDIKATGTQIAYQPDPGGRIPVMPDNPAHKVEGRLFDADETPPNISSISFADRPGPGADSTYVAGDWIGVWVTFDEGVLTTGTPQVELDIGGTARQAVFGHLPGEVRIDRDTPNPTWLFGYTVQEGDVDTTDGISIGENKVSLNGGTIKDEAGNDAVLTHDALAADSGHKVKAPDKTAPTVSSVAITSSAGDDSTYAIGDSIRVTVTFSEDVTVDVSGTLQLELDFDATAKNADYHSSDSSAVVFNYTVAAADADSTGIAIGADKISLDDATIRDGADNDATLTHAALAADAAHKVDGVRPAFSSAATSTDGTQVIVTFSEETTIPALLRSISTIVNVALDRFFIAVVGVAVDDDEVVPTAASLADTTLTMTLGSAVTRSQEVEVAYDNIFARDAVGIFIDGAGNALNTFSSQDVTNNSTVADAEAGDDPPELTLGQTELNITEGATADYTVVLGSEPTADVTVTIASSSSKLSASSTTLTFTTDDWETAQTVTLTANQDDDELNYWVSVAHTASGGGYDSSAANLYVVIDDDDDE